LLNSTINPHALQLNYWLRRKKEPCGDFGTLRVVGLRSQDRTGLGKLLGLHGFCLPSRLDVRFRVSEGYAVGLRFSYASTAKSPNPGGPPLSGPTAKRKPYRRGSLQLLEGIDSGTEGRVY
jgi:hypothetical protein